MYLKFFLAIPGLAVLLASHAAMADPNILTRSQWGAKPPGKKMIAHKPRFITIHHSAVRKRRGSLARKMKNLQRFSQKRERLASGKMKVAWADVPYHFVINATGRIAEGRNINFAGDTNTSYNPKNHIQIVLEGNFQHEQPGKAQLKKLQDLLVMLARRWKIPASAIKGHKHYASTACPGKNLMSKIPLIRKAVAKRL